MPYSYGCEPDGGKTMLKGDLLRFIISKNRALQEYLETTVGHYTGAIYCSLKEEDCDFTKQGPMRSSSDDTLPAECIEKAV